MRQVTTPSKHQHKPAGARHSIRPKCAHKPPAHCHCRNEIASDEILCVHLRRPVQRDKGRRFPDRLQLVLPPTDHLGALDVGHDGHVDLLASQQHNPLPVLNGSIVDRNNMRLGNVSYKAALPVVQQAALPVVNMLPHVRVIQRDVATSVGSTWICSSRMSRTSGSPTNSSPPARQGRGALQPSRNAPVSARLPFLLFQHGREISRNCSVV